MLKVINIIFRRRIQSIHRRPIRITYAQLAMNMMSVPMPTERHRTRENNSVGDLRMTRRTAPHAAAMCTSIAASAPKGCARKADPTRKRAIQANARVHPHVGQGTPVYALKAHGLKSHGVSFARSVASEAPTCQDAMNTADDSTRSPRQANASTEDIRLWFILEYAQYRPSS
jgi:hypothetical protein